jgi:hypothetical protein
MKNRKLLLLCVAMLLVVTFGACNENKKAQQVTDEAPETSALDSTVYGVCGEASSMHNLQVITDVGDTLSFLVCDECDPPTDVQGGLMAGDHLAVVGVKTDGEMMARKVINITTLLGRWTSIDKDFEIEDGGTVRSAVKAETKSWTSWKIFNGQLVLNKDTFDVTGLGADSLYLENDKGIFVFKRNI